jgi:TrmH family RNA methyltransferase
MIDITSPSNPLIKEIKSLYKKKERWAKNLYLAEGIKIVEECIYNDCQIVNIIYSDELLNIKGGQALFNKIKSFKGLIHVPDKLYKEISDTETPQGILAVIGFEVNSIKDLNMKGEPFLLLLDEVQDPGNMGTIIRTADAFGIDGIIVTEGCVDIYNPKVVRSTMGSIFRTPIFHELDGIGIIEKLKEDGIKIYSTSLEGSQYIQDTNFKEACLLIIGNESKGVSESLHFLADKLIKIPMIGKAESLNAAVASSIIMYEAIRQRIQ